MAIYRCHGTTPDGSQCALDPYKSCGARVETYTGEVNGYDDSDFTALVWDEDVQATVTITYGTTRYWTYHNYAVADATPDVIEKALAFYRKQCAAFWISDAHHEAAKVRHGVVVRSLTLRGKNVGVVGTVRWIGRGRHYGQGARVGVKVDGEDKLRYLDTLRVEVVASAPVDEAKIREDAAKLPAPHSWVTAREAVKV
jgi:hypothetical protein